MSLRASSARVALAGLVTLGLLACTAEPLDPSADSRPAVTPSLVGGLLGGITGTTTKLLTTALQLLTCPLELPQQSSAVIGAAGGRLAVGRHELVVPAGALDHDVLISGALPGDGTASVEFQPEGLRFKTPARLELDYGPCALVSAPKRVVYTTDDASSIVEVLPSEDDPDDRIVTGRLDHFSRYAVAW